MSRPLPGAARAPSTALPLAYLLTAAAAFLVAALGVPWLAPELGAHYYHPRVLALTHTLGLGWLTLTIMGASYQLLPIALECRVWSERLAWWQLWLLGGGIVGMVGHFWLARWSGLAWAAGLVAFGAGAHVVNVTRSLRALGRWSFTAGAFAGAVAGLGLTVAFGLVLAAHRVWPFLATDFLATLHAHFHLALLGWVAPMIVGVAAKVYPMFLLAPEPGRRLTSVQGWGLGLGVPGVVLGLLGWRPLLIPGALAALVSLGAHAAWTVTLVRQRRRPTLDWGLRFLFTGAAFLAPAGLLGLAQALDLAGGPAVALAYAALGLGGWVSLTIVGMMLKIVPFLVWYRIYAPRVGRTAVPTLAQLSWPAGEAIAYAGLAGGTLGLAGALLAQAPFAIAVAGGAIGVGAIAFCLVLGRVLGHLSGGAPLAAGGAREEVTAR